VTSRIDIGSAPVAPHARGPEVIVLGAACRDVAPDDPRGWRMGGGVSYSALATARLGLRTAAIIGLDWQAESATELDMLTDAGVDLLRVPLARGTIFHNLETPAGRVQTCVDLGEAVPVVPLPDSWRAAPAWMVVPVSGETTDAWASAIPDHAFVAVGWQGLLRDLVPGSLTRRRPPVPSALLARADLVGLSHFDVDPATPVEALARVMRPGAWLVITQGAHGGLLTQVADGGRTGEVLRYAPARSEGEVDPVGAGDTFLAALAATVVHRTLGGTRSRRGPLDLAFAAAAGALAVEQVGMAGAPQRGAVLGRLERRDIRRVADSSDGLRVDSFETPPPTDPAAVPAAAASPTS
jgi:sugar/nucleoside kinase (ribokinase family)